MVRLLHVELNMKVFHFRPRSLLFGRAAENDKHELGSLVNYTLRPSFSSSSWTSAVLMELITFAFHTTLDLD